MEGKRSTIDDHPTAQRAVPTQILSKLWAVLLLFWQNHILPELYFFGHLICIWLLFASSSSNHSLPWTFLVFTPLCKTKYESKQTLCEFQSTVFALFVYKGSRSFFLCCNIDGTEILFMQIQNRQDTQLKYNWILFFVGTQLHPTDPSTI